MPHQWSRHQLLRTLGLASKSAVLAHQIVSIEFADGIAANFSMAAFTSYHGEELV